MTAHNDRLKDRTEGIFRQPGAAQGRAASAGSQRDAGRSEESQDQEESALKIHPFRGAFAGINTRLLTNARWL
jgi:hypothetical protein